MATDSESEESVMATAAVLVLIDGASADVSGALRGMADDELIARIERTLTTGDRTARARALAGPLGRVALALEQWGLG